MMRWGFFILWVVGIICFISLIVSVGKDFRSLNNVNEEKIALVNPAVNMLEISSNSNGRYNRFRMEPFAGLNDDTAYVDNVSIRIEKSTNDSFKVTLIKFCHGRTRHDADTLAALMNYNVSQRDSTLFLDRGIPITEQDKFRNQQVVVTISVPVGKRIIINKRVGWGNWENFRFPWSENGDNYDWDNESYSWYGHQGEELIMHEDGLYTLDGKRTNEDWGQHRRTMYRKIGPNKIKVTIDENDNDNPGYRYDQTQKTIDSLRVIKEKQVQKLKDSLQKKKEELEKKLEKIDQNTSADAITGKKFDFILSI